jgi:hypothetical protein
MRTTDKEWQTLKECISRLDDRVDELSSTILKSIQVNKLPFQRRTSKTSTGEVSKPSSNQSSRKREVQPTVPEKYALTTSGPVPHINPKTSTSVKGQTRTKLEQNDSFCAIQTLGASNDTSLRQRTEVKQPLTSNIYGLRGRRVCTDVDNRVRLIKEETRKKDQLGTDDSSPVEQTVKPNLPTKERNLKPQTVQETPTSKQ